MTMQNANAIFLTSYPEGLPTSANFVSREIDLPEPGEGEMLLRTVWMSVDPYMRGRMRPNVKSYIPPFTLDKPLVGGAVCEVMKSNIADYQPGDYVVDMISGWKDYSLSNGRDVRKVDGALAPLSTYLGVLGMPGLTAWAGLTQIIKPKEGDTIFVSGAAGAVGSVVCQLAKAKGCKVVASAGSAEKCAWLTDEAGVDAAINYKDYPDVTALTEALASAAPDGVNGYFENVGGMHFEAALNCMAQGGRIALCGWISNYNDQEPRPGPSNMTMLVVRGVTARGFIVGEFQHQAMEFVAEVAPLVASGKIKAEETVYDGLDAAPEAFLGLFSGANLGKALVRVGPDKL